MRIKTTSQMATVIKNTRVDLGWSQQELAERALVGRDWIARLENGRSKPQLDLVLRTLTALNLGVTISKLPENPLNSL